MKHIQRLILTVLSIAVVLSGTTVGAAATNLPAGMLIGDNSGLRVTPQGEYFINADGLEPGDVITKQLILYNTEPYAYRVTMSAEPLEETGPLHLLDETRCTLTMNGAVLYDGRVRGGDGIDMIRNKLDLGILQSGDRRTVDITLTVSPQMKKYGWSVSEAFFLWHFYAAQSTPPDRPKTGETIKQALYLILPGMVLAMGILLVIKKRQMQETSDVTTVM